MDERREAPRRYGRRPAGKCPEFHRGSHRIERYARHRSVTSPRGWGDEDLVEEIRGNERQANRRGKDPHHVQASIEDQNLKAGLL